MKVSAGGMFEEICQSQIVDADVDAAKLVMNLTGNLLDSAGRHDHHVEFEDTLAVVVVAQPDSDDLEDGQTCFLLRLF